MSRIQIHSAESPYDDPLVAPLAAATLGRVEAMGLCPERVERLDTRTMEAVGERMAAAGIGRFSHRLPLLDPVAVADWLRATLKALDGSPSPATEWPALSDTLGLDLLPRLVGISTSSARRYAAGARQTPDSVAARLHFLALVTGDLAGGYNDIGIRRWFNRKRSALGGSSPAEVLVGAWSPEQEGALRVRKLAASLGFSPAT